MAVGVIGAGAWGTTVASLLAEQSDVKIWARNPELADAISAGSNPRYLAGFPLPPLQGTTNLAEVATNVEAIFIGVPSHGFRDVLTKVAPQIAAETPIISLSKGIERSTKMRMTQVIQDVLPHHDPHLIGVLSGPNLAKEIMAGDPAATVIALRSEEVAQRLQSLLMTSQFRVYTNNDVIGSEIAGALKNVMAIASGIVRGMGFGMNTTTMLITRALAEITRLGTRLGGSPLTFGGLAGIGDLMATCLSAQSRNFTVGYGLGEGKTLETVVSEMTNVAEGVKSTQPILELAEANSIEMPIAREVGRILYEGADPQQAIARLMGRTAKQEAHGIGTA